VILKVEAHKIFVLCSRKVMQQAWEKIIDVQKGFFFCVLWGEIMVKKAKGAKVKVIFQGLHMTHVIFALVYNFVFCILKAPFNTTF
jgi:hypothetical protein